MFIRRKFKKYDWKNEIGCNFLLKKHHKIDGKGACIWDPGPVFPGSRSGSNLEKSGSGSGSKTLNPEDVSQK